MNENGVGALPNESFDLKIARNISHEYFATVSNKWTKSQTVEGLAKLQEDNEAGTHHSANTPPKVRYNRDDYSA